MGNGQKAAMRRDKQNAAKKSGANSQLKKNESAKNIQCNICRQTFLMTIRKKALEEHISSKHDGKAFDACFPNFTE